MKFLHFLFDPSACFLCFIFNNQCTLLLESHCSKLSLQLQEIFSWMRTETKVDWVLSIPLTPGMFQDLKTFRESEQLCNMLIFSPNTYTHIHFFSFFYLDSAEDRQCWDLISCRLSFLFHFWHALQSRRDGELALTELNQAKSESLTGLNLTDQ